MAETIAKKTNAGTWWCDRCNKGRGKQSDWNFVKLESGVGYYQCTDCGCCVCTHCHEPIDRYYSASGGNV